MTRWSRKRVWHSALLVLFVAVLAYLVLVPLARLQVLAFAEGGRGYRVAYSAQYVGITIRNTLGLAFGSLCIGLFFGTLLAWWASRLPPRLSFLRMLPVLPIVVPAVAIVSGWAFLLSPRPGYLNAILRLLPWWSDLTEGPADAYSVIWIILITGFSLTAFVYLFVSAGIQNISAELIEAARVHGASAFGSFLRVTLPLLRPVLLYGGGIALLLGLGQFTAPLLLGTNRGVSVLTTDMYAAVSQSPIDYAVAAAIGSPLLVFGVAIVVIQKLLLGNQARFVTHGGRAFRVAGKPSAGAAVGIVVYTVLTTLLPIVALVILALSNFWSPRVRVERFTLDNFRQIIAESGIVDAIVTSVVASFVSVLIALVIGFIVACVQLRMRRHRVLRMVLDLVVALPLGVPAVIFGAGFLFAYSQPPLILYGTPWVLVVVYVTLMLPFATRMMLSGMLQLGEAYREAARTSGASAFKTDLRIILPLMRPALGGATALMFVLLMQEFTASVLVRSPNNQVMGTVLFDYWGNGGFPLVAAIALMMTCVTGAGLFCAMLIGGRDVLNKM